MNEKLLEEELFVPSVTAGQAVILQRFPRKNLSVLE